MITAPLASTIGNCAFTFIYSHVAPKFALLCHVGMNTQMRAFLVSAVIQGALTYSYNSQVGEKTFFQKSFHMLLPFAMIYSAARYFHDLSWKTNLISSAILGAVQLGIGTCTDRLFLQQKNSSNISYIISEEAPSKNPLKTPDWNEFIKYVETQCEGVEVIVAVEKAARGLKLIQQLHLGKEVKQENLEQQLSDACWGMMLYAITNKQAFREGTFDFPDPNHRFFHFFESTLYGRRASHYETRTILMEEGPWEGYGHFGLDIYRDGSNDLPANKRTVLIGRIQTRDGSNRTYLKMEEWGANLNILSDSRALPNLDHIINHGYEFLVCQAKTYLPQIFGVWVDGEPYIRKEFMFQDDRNMCIALHEDICKIKIMEGYPFDLDGYGFQDAIPFFRAALKQPSIMQQEELSKKICGFLDEIEKRYDNLTYRHGNEVNIQDSILRLDPTPPTISFHKFSDGNG